MSVRKVFFWMHLAAGVVAGVVIGIMCFTGVALAFQAQIVAWAERDVRTVTPPTPDAPRLAVQELLRKVRAENSETRPTAIVVSSDPHDAVAFALGRDSVVYADPYTGEIRRPQSTRARATLRVLENWHRTLALGGNQRVVGKLINGTCNLVFCFLALSGLYLWMPRSWSWRSVRAIAWFDGSASGKRRDFNWHNTIGLWCAPVLVVLTLTAVPMSFRWGNALVYQLAGEAPPATPAAGTSGAGVAAREVAVPAPPVGGHRLDYDALLAVAQHEAPGWRQLTLRLNNAGQRGGAGAPGARAPAATPVRREGDGEHVREGRSEKRSDPQPVNILIWQPGQWPRTATTTLTLNPFTGDVLKREGYAEQSTARKIRSWTRFLHTGEALGPIGQFIAGLACLGGCFLVYTGFALACRRLIAWKRRSVET